jgi:hypothetical protein
MTRIAMSPLTGIIYAGRVNKAGHSWVGAKTDVTSDFLRAVLEKAAHHGGSFEIRGSSGTLHTVTVTATPPAERTEGGQG